MQAAPGRFLRLGANSNGKSFTYSISFRIFCGNCNRVRPFRARYAIEKYSVGSCNGCARGLARLVAGIAFENHSRRNVPGFAEVVENRDRAGMVAGREEDGSVNTLRKR